MTGMTLHSKITAAKPALPHDVAPNAPLQQHPHYGRVMAALGAQVSLETVQAKDGTPGTLLVLRRRLARLLPLAVASRGPVWVDGAPHRWRARPSHWREPLLLTAEDDHGRGVALMTPTHVAELDLRPSLHALRSGLHGKWRNRLLKGEDAGFVIVRGKHPDWLIAAEAKQRASRGYRALPGQFVDVWQETGGETLLLEARRGAAQLAGMLFLIHGKRATYQLGWSSSRGKDQEAHRALLWRAIVILRAKGLERLDLGTLATDRSPGLARFKIGTGASVRALAPTRLVWP